MAKIARLKESALLAPVSRSNHFDQQPATGWLAHLQLTFDWQEPRTRLKFLHEGPLRIQKALYPQGASCCHAVVVHPPAGVAAGDQLHIDIHVAPSAHAVVTTPSATKWYGAFDAGLASQTIRMDLQGKLEWIPAETIVFDGAQVCSTILVNADDHACMIGWDLLVFGRHGSGEHFKSGCFDQRVCVQIDGTAIWIDRLKIQGDDALFDSPIGLDGHHSMSTFWAISTADQLMTTDQLNGLRQAVPEMAFTQLHPRLLVGRQLGDPLALDPVLKRVRAWVTEHCWQSRSDDLRLWAT